MITFESAIWKLTFKPDIQSYVLVWITFSPNKACWRAFFPQQTLEKSQATQPRGFSATRDTSHLLLQLRSLITDRAKRSGPILLIFPYYTLSVINCSAVIEIMFFLPPCSLPISHLLWNPCQSTVLSSHLKQPSLKGNPSAEKKTNAPLFLAKYWISSRRRQRLKMDKMYPWTSAGVFFNMYL